MLQSSGEHRSAKGHPLEPGSELSVSLTSLLATGEACEPPLPGKSQYRLKGNILLASKKKKKKKKVQKLLSVIDIWPLKVSLSFNTYIDVCASGTRGRMEEGMPTSNRPAETLNFVTSAPGNILVQGDFFFPAAFRGAVKSSSESHSAWETALSRLRNRGPWQVPEPSEEQLVIPA